MYTLNKNTNNSPGTKFVRIQGKQSKTKKKGYNIQDQDIDYLKQVIRTKNKEVKRGGGKMEKLLTNNQEIEALLARGSKRSKKQTQGEKKEIEKMLETNSNLKTEVQEVDLTSKIPSNSRKQLENENNNNNSSKNTKSNPKNSENNSNFLEKLVNKKNKSSNNSANQSKRTNSNQSNNNSRSKTSKSNINLDLTGVKFRKTSKTKNKPKTPTKKTKKKEFPKELSKLTKKNHSFISQLLKPNLKMQKSIQKKNLKNLKKDSSTIKLTKLYI